MTELQKQVQRAQKRINFQSFLSACIWSLAICMGMAAIAIGVGKVWHLGVDSDTWTISWLAGGVVVGLLAAVVWTWINRNSLVDAAIEIDRRYGLKERVSSSLALTPQEADSEIGRALIDDASKRVGRIDVKEHFGVRTNRWAFLPFATGALAIALVFLPDAAPTSGEGEVQAKTVEVKKVKKSTDALKKKIASKKKELDQNKLKEASKLATKLEKSVDEFTKQNGDKKKAMVEMNNLAKMVRQKRESMQGSEDLKKKLNQLKGMKVKEGPADQLARAMQNGDFKEALKQVNELQQQLKNGNLNPKQMAQLGEQMNQMQKKMNDIAKKHEQQKKELQEQIEQAKKQGNKAAAKKLQKKLEQLQAQDKAMKKMQKMANQMQQMAKNMKEGNQKQAGQQLAQMAEELESMQQELAEMEALDDLMAQLDGAKNSMNCQGCDGEGCAMCQGMGFGQNPEGMPGFGMGQGRGQGDRPEEKTDYLTYDAKVKANIRKGRLVVTGNVAGPNKPGEALEEIKEAMAAAETAEENPLNNVRLPKAQLEQAREYFDLVRDGNK